MKPFSIIIPVYNEERILSNKTRTLIDYLGRFDTRYEIIIASNGSIDGTTRIGRDLAETYGNVRFFHLNRRGPGEAFKKAVQIASFDVVISLDMDLSTRLGFVDRALTLVENGYDLIIGSKKMGFQKRSAWRVIGSGLFILMAALLLDLPFRDYSIGAKAYRRDLLLKYLDSIDSGTSYVLKIVYLARRDSARLLEIPVRCRDLRKSKFNIIHEGIYRFGNLFALWWDTKRPLYRFRQR